MGQFETESGIRITEMTRTAQVNNIDQFSIVNKNTKRLVEHCFIMKISIPSSFKVIENPKTRVSLPTITFQDRNEKLGEFCRI